MKLTPEQQAVVRHCQGPLLVLAPVGTGKTTVLARRLLAAIEAGIPAQKCLCITFTNRAAKELTERIQSLQPQLAKSGPLVSTFHSFCARLLRQEAPEAGLRSDFSIYDEEDSAELLARSLPVEGGERENEKLRHAGHLLQHWSRGISALSSDDLLPTSVPTKVLDKLKPHEMGAFGKYLQSLKEHNAIDFSLLVYKARSLLKHNSTIRERWRELWQWIQVDEFQDTHHSEWEMLETLALYHSNLALFGDLDQTIYGWRGSQPAKLLQAFHQRWPKAQTLDLSINHRGTRELLRLAERTARQMAERRTSLNPSAELQPGNPVKLLQGKDPAEEAKLVAQHLLKQFSEDPESKSSTAILLRAQHLVPEFRKALGEVNIDCATESDMRFFRHREVRDALAPLQLLINPQDRSRLARWLRWSGRLNHSASAALKDLLREGPACHLRMTDLLDTRTLKDADPFAQLLNCWQDHVLAVVDLETTGLEPWNSEIVEIAAFMVAGGFEVDRFERLLKVNEGLQGSQQIHGISEAMLAEEGVEAAEALRELSAKLSGVLLVGHNFSFDLEFLLYHWNRIGIPLNPPPWIDTLELARRTLPARGGYSLGALKERLQLKSEPTHRASADVSCTVELLASMIAPLQESREEREDLIRQHRTIFHPWADTLERWRSLAWNLRPADLLEHILREEAESGTGRSPSPEVTQKLLAWIRRQDPKELPPWFALRDLLGRSSLNRGAELQQEGRLPILTIHASKGMEFDHVILAGASEGILPDYRSTQNDNLEEERRVFYVAITRPRKSLLISSSRMNHRGESSGWSRFVSHALPVDQEGGR